VRSSEGCLAGAPIHFAISFPQVGAAVSALPLGCARLRICSERDQAPPASQLIPSQTHHTQPQDYPLRAPEVHLYTPVPHPNVVPLGSGPLLVRGVRQPRWRLALFDCVPGHSTWSRAYSVLSVLVQLQGEPSRAEPGRALGAASGGGASVPAGCCSRRARGRGAV
jgi:hypothetical protein